MELYKREDSPYWYFVTEIDGKIIRRSTRVYADRARRKEAAAAAEHLVQELRRENAARAGARLADLIEDMIEHREDLTEASKKRYRDAAVAFLSKLPSSRVIVSEVTPPWIRQTFANLRKNSSVNELRWYRLVTKLGVDHAITTGVVGAPEVNPFEIVGRITPKKPKHRTRRALSVDKLLVLFDGVKGDPFWEPFLTTIVDTGMRHRECLGLRWIEIDFKARVINLPPEREKTRRGRVIPMSDAVHTALLSVKIGQKPSENHNEWVWISERTRRPLVDIDLRWRNLRNRLGLGPVRIHDLRHSFATHARTSGMSKEDRKSVMGQTSDDVHAIYADADLDALKETVRKHSIISRLAQQRQSTEVS